MTTLSSIEQAIVQAVSRERLMADTQAIARWVRLSGTEDERKAFGYIADTLRQCGVEPTLYTGYGLISLPISAQLRAGQKELRAITHAMAVSTPEKGLQLNAVYVGSGGAESYASRDVQGKAVVIDGIAMPAKVLTAQRAGAAACIFVNQDELVHEMIVSSIWGAPTPWSIPARSSSSCSRGRWSSTSTGRTTGWPKATPSTSGPTGPTGGGTP